MQELKVFADKLAEALNNYGDTLDRDGITHSQEWEVSPHIDGIVTYAQDGWIIHKQAEHVQIGEPVWPTDFDDRWNVDEFDEAYLVLTHWHDFDDHTDKYKLSICYAQDCSKHLGDLYALPEKQDRPEYLLELCWSIVTAFQLHRNDPDDE